MTMDPGIGQQILVAALPIAVSLLILFLTRERNQGKDNATLVQTKEDAKALKEANVDIQATLSNHTLLHEQMEKWISKTDERLRTIESQQNQALGREQGRRRQT